METITREETEVRKEPNTRAEAAALEEPVVVDAPHAEPVLPEPDECMDVEQVPEKYREQALLEGNAPLSLLVYGLLGLLFGIILVKSQVVSWFRIQEMFRFQGIHMYGIFATALAVAIPAMAWIRRTKARTVAGAPISIDPKVLGRGTRYWAGGLMFGVGWALTGACPGPIFALVGAGFPAMIVVLVFALIGHWTYARLRPSLPH